MNHELPPLPDDVSALLQAAEAGAPPPPLGLEAAVLAKVTATVAVPAAVASTTLIGTLVTKPILAVALAVSVVGAGIGTVALVTTRGPAVASAPVSAPATAPIAPIAPIAQIAPVASIAPPLAPVASIAPPLAPVESIAPPIESSTPLESSAPIARVRRAPVERGPVESAPVVQDDGADSDERAVESETQLVEGAREALARGDGDAALARLREHAQRFARGKLTEERRALTVVAFAQQGDRARALSAARAFEREHPSSLFLEMVRAAVVDEGGVP